jgi:hypothetical protein
MAQRPESFTHFVRTETAAHHAEAVSAVVGDNFVIFIGIFALIDPSLASAVLKTLYPVW